MEKLYSVDVTDENFEEVVMEESYKRAVVVDFWAQWCGPCRTLKPILEKLAKEYNFLLAKVNVDENPHIAQEFGVQGIPDVRIFINGKEVDKFVGALPEPRLRDLLSKHIKSELDKKLEEAKMQTLSGNREEAEKIYKELIEKYPDNKKLALEVAQFFINENKLDEAEKLLNTIKEYHKEYYVKAQAVKELINFKRTCEELKPENELDELYKKASCEVLEGKYEEALKDFLQIVQKDKNYRDEAGRKGMIAVFNLIGEGDPLTKEYRKKLAMALY